ncbi:MAG: hypothetical protein EHM90_05725 [Chloroflexi bacterium]|nr:MAG: hypothetical protein EHM90_05725 [Chloroflexota bacterium]
MDRRSLLPDLAALILLGWVGLILFVQVPILLGDDPFANPAWSVTGAILAGAHLAAVVGIVRRMAWGRRLGLWIGGLAMFGTAVVLVTWTVNALATIGPSADALTAILIPAGMFASYAVVVGLLWRARPEFSPPNP